MSKPTATLRATRADPPGLAKTDQARREVYSAALQQSEDLFDAAAASGAVARPIPLYYAVSQAGRAIAAAWVQDNWRARGHGLKEDGGHNAWKSQGILGFRIKPAGYGVFGAVAESLNSGGLCDSVELGALWAALPLILAPPGGARQWRSALRLIPMGGITGPVFLRIGAEHQGVLIVLDGHGRDADSVNQLLQNYRAADGARARVIQGILAEEHTPYGPGIPIQWPAPTAPIDDTNRSDYIASLVRNRIPQYRYRGEHWLVPRVGAANDDLTPLLLWWVLLFGLSLLARYEPADWRKALDPDGSEAGVFLEALLDEALRDLPRLLTDALTHQQHLEPAQH
ncbi:MAG: hypothetical protein ABI427_14610 [Solirubrobacteraceae bacterium]